MIVYQVINKIDGSRYIGQTIRPLHRRWAVHCSEKSNCVYLSRAIKKYGKDNFSIEIIDRAETQEDLNAKEEFWIKFLDTMVPNGYNLDGGGNRTILSEESRKKISIALKGRKVSPDVLEKIRFLAKERAKNLTEKDRIELGNRSRKWWNEKKMKDALSEFGINCVQNTIKFSDS